MVVGNLQRDALGHSAAVADGIRSGDAARYIVTTLPGRKESSRSLGESAEN